MKASRLMSAGTGESLREAQAEAHHDCPFKSQHTPTVKRLPDSLVRLGSNPVRDTYVRRPESLCPVVEDRLGTVTMGTGARYVGGYLY